ncbi:MULTISPECIES: Txe/YoeB family addiction module toxin [Methylomicrobium]|uniref:Putative mRNA interferase YoeB n=1 Tax=Methylomicrobium album BG8 TaxID=686340 RepID=H8GK86_METAL|nr:MULTISPECIES: Txe/YoeB family addiction module toxin [Methylomicrobium]EIC29210.1 toxin-antitoxin system, toxin component, Txe/YoeB family [Methylomicrobium album BG8]
MIISFEATAFDDFNQWAIDDKKCHKRIVTLIKDICRNPYEGLGKPEPLKYELQGYWSRRIDDEHRLVYKIQDGRLIVISCKYHYKK